MEKAVFICIDTIIATSDMINVCFSPLIITIRNKTKKFSSLVKINKDNVAQSVNTKACFINAKKQAIINVSIDNYQIMEAEVDIRSNVVGVLRSADEISLTLIFRVINNSNDTIILHGVKQLYMKDFRFVRRLGVGSFGETYEVVDSSQQSHVFKIMIKQIDITNEDDDCTREIIPFLAFPKHPCLIGLEGFVYDRNRGVILVLEFASRGIISSIGFSELCIDLKLKILYGLSSCVAFLHDHGFIHRDIHPSNVLVSDNYEAKLIDFGVSRFYEEKMTEDVGHQGYQSPEMMNYNDYDPLVDEFSLGVLLEHLNNEELFFKILAFFLKDEDPISRISCTEICTLIESEMFYTNTDENENYFSYLSKYHQSQPLRDSTIVKFVLVFSFYNHCEMACDFVILAKETVFYSAEYRSWYFVFIDGIAFDTEMFSYLSKLYFHYRIKFSKNKFELLYNYYLDQPQSKANINLLFFMIYHRCDFYSKYLNKLTDQDIIDMIDFFVKNIGKKWCYKKIFKPILELAHRRNNQEIINEFAYKAMSKDVYIILEVAKCLRHAADNGSNEACIPLSHLLLYSVKNGKEEGIYYAKKALKNKYYRAALELHNFYLWEQKIKKSFKYLKIYAEETNDLNYLCKLAVHYLFGGLINQDIEKGIKMLRTCADAGNSHAQSSLAMVNFFGFGTQINYDQAFWYNYLAIQQNNYEGLFIHGMYYFFGLSFIEQDYLKARRILEECLVYYKEIITDPDEIVIWYLYSLTVMSVIYILGLGVEINVDRANKYCKCFRTFIPSSEVYKEFHVLKYYKDIDSYLVEDECKHVISRSELSDQLIEFIKEDLVIMSQETNLNVGFIIHRCLTINM